MLWITGGRTVVAAAATATGWPALAAVEAQMHHVPWHGFTAWDLVFPLFLFLSGATLPFSQDRKREAGESRSRLARRIVRRAFLLVLLGAVYNGLLRFELDSQRWASVLGRIGLAWAGAAAIALFVGTRGRALAVVGILAGYAALLSFWPQSGGAGAFVQGQNVVDLFDQRFLPGRLHRGDHDPEGLLSTVPAIATALLGALAGERLRRVGKPRIGTAVELLVAGLVLLGLGWALDPVVPVNKALWTPSFVLVAGGWSAILLGVFHAWVDVGVPSDTDASTKSWRRRLAFPLVVLGANAITLYLLDRFVAFDALVAFLLDRNPPALAPVWIALAAVGLRWLCLWGLWRRRWFLRV